MTANDWAALTVLVGFLVVGRLDSNFRRQRVSMILVAFLALYLYPWVTGLPWSDSIMPFRSYSLYSTGAPKSVSHAEIVMVDTGGREYPVDFRVWQPFIPRVFNGLLWGAFREPRPEGEAEQLARVLLSRTRVALKQHRERGEFRGFDAYLLGSLSMPQHQTPARCWERGAALPPPSGITMVRIYRIDFDSAERARDPSSYKRTLLFEFQEQSPRAR
jgi:hypothetical protein